MEPSGTPTTASRRSQPLKARQCWGREAAESQLPSLQCPRRLRKTQAQDWQDPAAQTATSSHPQAADFEWGSERESPTTAPSRPLTCGFVEPEVGVEPTTFRLRGG